MRLQRRITTAARCRTRYSSRRLVVGAKSGKQYSAATLSAFGEDLTVNAAGDSSHSPFPVPHSPFFTGKPHVAGLGHAFLMRNYRASLSKWQTADPLGYPDGWNQLAYCNNGVTSAVDLWGCWVADVHHDINATWISDEIGSENVNSYTWGGFDLPVLNIMNSASDWTDNFFVGNQDDALAYLHAMSSEMQSEDDAKLNWMYYLSQCQNNALELAEDARQAYRRRDYVSAISWITQAIDWMGCLVHTFVDEIAPPHHGFQHFSWWSSIQHRMRETVSVYVNNGYRDSIKGRLDEWWLPTLREVLRQPE